MLGRMANLLHFLVASSPSATSLSAALCDGWRKMLNKKHLAQTDTKRPQGILRNPLVPKLKVLAPSDRKFWPQATGEFRAQEVTTGELALDDRRKATSSTNILANRSVYSHALPCDGWRTVCGGFRC